MAENLNTEQDVDTYTEVQDQENAVTAGKYLMKERFEIDFAEHISWLDNNGAKAYAVSDRIDSTRRLFALVCSNETSPRMTILPYLKSIDNPALMKMVEYGVINFLPEESKNMALIYEMPLGGKVFEKGISNIDLASNNEKFRKVALSLMGLNDAFKGMEMTHRAIRADNLYYKDAERTEIVVGDCAASFPAYYQPPMFEPIESLMADRQARGNGTIRDDIYSIGNRTDKTKIMAYDKHGKSIPVSKRGIECLNLPSYVDIKSTGRLICNKKLNIIHKCRCNIHTLFHSP